MNEEKKSTPVPLVSGHRKIAGVENYMIPSEQEYEQLRSPPELLLFWKQCCESLTEAKVATFDPTLRLV